MPPTSLKSAAPWRAAFHSQISKLSIPAFTISTIHDDPMKTTASPPTMAVGPQPRARTVVFRGFWGELPANPHNPAPRNPQYWQSEVLCITTDVRMAKVVELGGDENGGGGPFEAVFWIPDTMAQWRIRGRGYFLGQDADDNVDKCSLVRDQVQPRMWRASSEEGQECRQGLEESSEMDRATKLWSWAREVTAHFGNLSPMMRGSFRNPAPGTALSSGPGREGLGQGQSVEDLHDALARENFRVVLLVPDEVDYVDLSDSSKAKRWLYTIDGGEWGAQELWP
ncbi:hypothetical protein Cpir12675_001376 [Ceratocystis pirilliformis]|uniref:Pyridoxamine 5'-phosphate oxidase Alr4036 family FMN-binding domain-containing protein n=1 Tax=Ceratocystis pirilliformis TaxID=259994 RepID=A0ABR3ZHC0_9PEZI